MFCSIVIVGCLNVLITYILAIRIMMIVLCGKYLKINLIDSQDSSPHSQTLIINMQYTLFRRKFPLRELCIPLTTIFDNHYTQY